MNQFPRLPTPDAAPHPESEDYEISFVRREFGAYSAVVKNEYGDKVDEIREPSFAMAYETVSINYPQAKWTPKEDEEEDTPSTETGLGTHIGNFNAAENIARASMPVPLNRRTQAKRLR